MCTLVFNQLARFQIEKTAQTMLITGQILSCLVLFFSLENSGLSASRESPQTNRHGTFVFERLLFATKFLSQFTNNKHRLILYLHSFLGI